MKQSLLFVGALISGLGAFAQQTPVSQTPQMRHAVLEELTGIHCGYCPDGHKRANDLAAANPGKVILVNIHAGGYATPGAGEPDFRTSAGTTIDGFFNPEGYPAGAVQRKPFGSETFLATSRANWNSQINSTLTQTAEANVALSVSIDASTRVATVHAEVFYTTPQASGTNHYLNIGILQNNVEGPQTNYGPYNTAAILPNGNYMHQHIFRGFINTGGTTGTVVDASSSAVQSFDITYTLPATVGNVPLNIGNLQFFAFVHEGMNTVNTSKIINGAEVDPTLSNVPAPTANASAITNMLTACNGSTISPVVKVTNDGDVINSISFSTVVNGGTPVTYTYSTPIPAFGSADITLPAVMVNAQGTNTCTVTITAVNGGSGTIGTASTTKTITVADGIANTPTATVKVTTDQYGSETSWKVLNSAGTTVAMGGPYSNGSAAGSFAQADVTFNVTPNECYKLVVKDEYGDGFDSGYGNGHIEVMSGTTNIAEVAAFPSGKEMQDAFQAASSLAVNELSKEIGMEVFPNPATTAVNVKFEADGSDYAVNIIDLAGRVVSSTTLSSASGSVAVELPLTDLQAGNYLVTVTSANATYTQKLMVK